MSEELLKIHNPLSLAVSVRREAIPRLNGQLHYHDETELIYFRKAEGVLLIDGHFHNFKKGDLFLIGGNLAHYWKHDSASFSSDIDSVVVHFKPDFLGKDFLETGEGAVVRELLNKAQDGLRVKGHVKSQVVCLMEKMLKGNGLARSAILLAILEKIAVRADIQTLNIALLHQNTVQVMESGAIERVYKYVALHFRRKITIGEIAEVANLSHHSFCRFFKNRTGKTFVHFLLEVRVNHACSLLAQKQQNLKTISQQSGFKNMACFYKYFKQMTGKTPRHYQDIMFGRACVK